MTRQTVVFATLAASLALGACSKEEPEATQAQPETKAAEAPADVEAKAELPAPEKAVEAEAEEDLHANFAKVEVDQLEQLIGEKKAVPVDANDAETRTEFGSLPGAVLLSSSKDFELSELPEDKSAELVFYCGSEKCMAAPKAAARAKEAGYTAVKVMPAGIKGWVKAGKPVEKT